MKCVNGHRLLRNEYFKALNLPLNGTKENIFLKYKSIKKKIQPYSPPLKQFILPVLCVRYIFTGCRHSLFRTDTSDIIECYIRGLKNLPTVQPGPAEKLAHYFTFCKKYSFCPYLCILSFTMRVRHSFLISDRVFHQEQAALLARSHFGLLCLELGDLLFGPNPCYF